MGPRAIRLRWLWRSRTAPRDTGLVAGSPSRDHTECSLRHGWHTGPAALLRIDFVAMCPHAPAVQLRRAITSGWPTTRVPSVNAVPFAGAADAMRGCWWRQSADNGGILGHKEVPRDCPRPTHYPKNGSRPRVLNVEVVIMIQHAQRRRGR